MRIRRREARGFLWAAWTSATTSAPRLLASLAGSNRFLPLLAGLALTSLTILSGCQRNRGVYDAFIRTDCLPAIPLVDQHDHQVSLSSLKGKPVLVDFIYTSCPGPCLTLTQKMARVAQKLAPQLGSSFTMVSITIDPEHDGSAQLAAYMKGQGIDSKGWLFLTGSPVNIERVLAHFQLRRKRDADGTVEHVEGVFMLGPDGHELREYDGEVVKAGTIVAELETVLRERRQLASNTKPDS